MPRGVARNLIDLGEMVISTSALLAVSAAASFCPPHAWSASQRLARCAPAVATESPESPPPLTRATIAELVEASFVPAVLGVARGDVTELKLFIAAAQTGYTRGHTLDDLSAEIDVCPAQSAGRPLMAEEVQLRTLWLTLIYLALEQLSGETAEMSGAVPQPLCTEYAPFVSRLLSAKRAGVPLSQLSVDGALATPQQPPGPAGDVDDSTAGGAPDETQRAVLKTSMRVVYLVVDVLDDVANAGGDSVPRPFIPGTGAGVDPE